MFLTSEAKVNNFSTFSLDKQLFEMLIALFVDSLGWI